MAKSTRRSAGRTTAARARSETHLPAHWRRSTSRRGIENRPTRELGYSPRPISRTIAETVQWFEENPAAAQHPAAARGRSRQARRAGERVAVVTGASGGIGAAVARRLARQGYRVPEIGPLVESHPANLRKWIHRFNEHGCAGLRTVHSGGPKRRFSIDQRTRIVRLAQTKPRDLGLNFTRWTLHRLAQQAEKQGFVDRISHECVRQILREAHCSYRLNGEARAA